jgi:hypothetical protein
LEAVGGRGVERPPDAEEDGAAAVGRAVVLFATNAGCRLFDAARPLEADPREALLESRGVAGIATLLSMKCLLPQGVSEAA